MTDEQLDAMARQVAQYIMASELAAEPPMPFPPPTPTQQPGPMPMLAPPAPMPMELTPPAPMPMMPLPPPMPLQQPAPTAQTQQPAPRPPRVAAGKKEAQPRPPRVAAGKKEVQPRPPRVAAGTKDVPRPSRAAGTKGVQLAAGDPGLRAKGRVPPVVTFQGRRAYAVTFQKGKHGPAGGNMSATLAPDAVFPAEECRLRFKVWFEKGFPWDPRTMKAVGGKLLGFHMGAGAATGGNYSTTGASMRVMWGKNGGAGPYFYPQLRQAKSKGNGKGVTWEDLDQSAEFRRVAYIATGVHMFYPGNKNESDIGKWDLSFVEGAWNEVELYVKLNAPGRSDGVVEMSVNGRTRRSEAVRYRYDPTVKMTGVRVHPFFGGGTDDFSPTHTTRAYFADFEFSKGSG